MSKTVKSNKSNSVSPNKKSGGKSTRSGRSYKNDKKFALDDGNDDELDDEIKK